MPAGTIKKELLEHLDKVPTYVQQLQFTVKEPTVGRAATFSKVDNVIQETKHLMNVISKVVTTCFDCANKVIYNTFCSYVNQITTFSINTWHILKYRQFFSQYKDFSASERNVP